MTMSVCEYSLTCRLWLCVYIDTLICTTYTHKHTYTLNPVRKSSPGPQGRQEKHLRDTKSLSCSLFFSLSDLSFPRLFFSPLSSSPSLLNPHLHIHRQRGSLRGAAIWNGPAAPLVCGPPNGEKPFPLPVKHGGTLACVHVCVCACTSAVRARVWMESCVVRQFHSLMGRERANCWELNLTFTITLPVKPFKLQQRWKK